MKNLRFSAHTFYRFPVVYLSLLVECELAWRFVTPAQPSYLCAFLTFLSVVVLLYSLSRTLVIFEKKDLLYEGKKTKKEKLVFFWKNPKNLIAMLLFLVLPFPSSAISYICGGAPLMLQYLLSRLLLPFFLLAFFTGTMAGLSWRELNEKKSINRSPLFYLLHSLKYIPLYMLAAFGLLILADTFSTAGKIHKLLISTNLTAFLIVFFTVVWTIRIVRAVLIRRKFINQLAEACTEMGIPTPKIDAPYRSLFRRKSRGTVFYITSGKKQYACKLISVFKSAAIYRFHNSGELGHVHVFNVRIATVGRFGMGSGKVIQQRTELYENRYNVGFDTEDGVQKIFIFNPCAKVVEGEYGDDSIPLDNGMQIGEYTFYTATGFCNALTRNCLDKKPNE